MKQGRWVSRRAAVKAAIKKAGNDRAKIEAEPKKGK